MSAHPTPQDEPSRVILERYCQYTPGLTILSQTWGRVRFADGRFSFVTDEGRTVVDAPIGELHSVRNWLGRGLTVYHGDRRLKFDFSHEAPSGALAAQLRTELPLTAAADGYGLERAAARSAENAALLWTSELRRVVAPEPPPGVTVKHTFGPEERWKYVALTLVGSVLVAAVLIGVVVALSLS